MKKLLMALSLAVMTMTAGAVPAKKGVWKTLMLTDGTEVKAQLVGDEHGHFWKGANGLAYRWTESGYETVDAKTIMEKAKARRMKANAQRMKRLPKRDMLSGVGNYTGKKKGLILLVNFSNKTFKTANNKALYQRIANEAGFSEGNFHGSMADYFKDQSLGQFELDFDVVGPLTVSKKYSYYGQNDNDENDMHPAEMVIEALNLAKDEVTDWKQYDWDDDGYVDQVYVVYAGYGEADYNGDSNVIWPHAYTLKEAKEYGDGTGPFTVADGLQVDTYACGAELNGSTGAIGGIGTMCHEFSHCLGYPDFYDIDYSGGQGMGNWDLMDSGSYNGDGYQPAGYTSYERWEAGWTEPVVLENTDTTVTSLESLQKSGKSFVIYNQRNRDEYFLLENRQLDGWDASLPGSGLLILHVDYSNSVWESNQPNDDPSHQRMTWMAADNKYQYETYDGTRYYTEAGMKNDTYPYGSNNAFNKDSKPAAQLYNKNTDGTKYLSSSVENIRKNSDGTVAFNFVASYSSGSTTPGDDEPYVKPTVEGALFYESFDDCDGKGGNDNLWSDKIANGEFITDNEGWTANGYGANECAKFGNSKNDGSATTPAFAVNGSSQLTFRAGAWNSTKDGTTLNLSVSNGTISPTSVTMERGEFNDFEATISATGNVKITFASSKGRFFLDEVLVKADETAAIVDLTQKHTSGRIYTIDGRYVGTDRKSLPRGLYLINGKKVLR